MKLWVRLILFSLILLWVIGIFIPFLVPSFGFLAYLYPFVERIYSTVCHQQPEKLIQYGEHTTMVCARCTGIYIGGLAVSLYFIFNSQINIKNGKLIILASVPMVIDVILYKVGLYNYSKIIAFISGAVFGSVGIAYIYNGLQILLDKNE